MRTILRTLSKMIAVMALAAAISQGGAGQAGAQTTLMDSITTTISDALTSTTEIVMPDSSTPSSTPPEFIFTASSSDSDDFEESASTSTTAAATTTAATTTPAAGTIDSQPSQPQGSSFIPSFIDEFMSQPEPMPAPEAHEAAPAPTEIEAEEPAAAAAIVPNAAGSGYSSSALYAFDRLSPERTRLLLLNALLIGLIGVVLSSDGLRRSFAELGHRFAAGTSMGRGISGRIAKKETYESQHH